jgi:CRP/FNR family transcriptional regulator, dissimilatory nitrate respiration regulator
VVRIDFTDEYKQLPWQIPLFRDLDMNVKRRLMDELDVALYKVSRKEVVLQQDTRCNHLYVLLKGELEVNIIDVAGNQVKVEEIIAPRAFATPHLFGGNNILPATFTASKESVLLMATRTSVFKLLSSVPQLLHSFLCVTGNCNKCTITRLRILSYKNLRSRFIYYLMEHCTSGYTALLEHNQAQLADYLGVTRPALSKEINKMIREGLISTDKREVTLLDVQGLKKYI